MSNANTLSPRTNTLTGKAVLLLGTFALLLLTGCSGSGGEATTVNPQSSDSARTTAFVYTGPTAQSPDVARFQSYLWANLINSDRCGACHGDGGQTPRFANSADVNAAYGAVQDYVNLTDPDSSAIVTKVGNGHNCWLESNSACADTMTSYLQNWAGTSINAAARSIDLSAPILRDAGSSKNFPSDAASFSSTVYPLLTTHCAECHSDTAAFAQSPYFASADLDTAYAAVKSKIDLNTPAQSRIVVRLGDEFHNCWSACSADAAAMLDAVTQLSNGISTTEVDPALVISKALRLTDGIVANAGGRFESNVIALWEFKNGSGGIAYDTSGVEPAMNLTLNGDVSWVGGWGQIRWIGRQAHRPSPSIYHQHRHQPELLANHDSQ